MIPDSGWFFDSVCQFQFLKNQSFFFRFVWIRNDVNRRQQRSIDQSINQSIDWSILKLETLRLNQQCENKTKRNQIKYVCRLSNYEKLNHVTANQAKKKKDSSSFQFKNWQEIKIRQANRNKMFFLRISILSSLKFHSKADEKTFRMKCLKRIFFFFFKCHSCVFN